MVQTVTTKNYRYGVVNALEDNSIKRGAASDSLNWVTKGDHIELRRGMAYLGSSSLNVGTGKITGLKKVTNSIGTELLFGTYRKKLKYYTTTIGEWTENGSDLLGSSVVGTDGEGSEYIFMSEYGSPAGNQMFVNSPNCSGYYKIMVANPGSSLNVYSASKNFNFNIKIDTNRTFGFGRPKDLTGVYGSYIDSQTFTTVTAESVGTGDGVTTHFTKTLAAISGTRTVFGLTVTAAGITLTDNYNGSLSASDGSTGTINYITGALVVDFFTAPAGAVAVTTTYQWEDSNAGGITDFTKSATRTAGQGFVFRQDEGGGPVQSINTFSAVYYCMHSKKTWALTIGVDDTTATNLAYRDRVGIPNERASVETGDGVFYIDDQNPDDVKVRLLTYSIAGSTQVVPVPVSNNLNLNSYRFDQAAAIEWGEYILVACRRSSSTANDRVLLYSKLWKSWDILDYNVSCFEIFEGTLVCGDSISNNFLTLFSGFDDLEEGVTNYWIGNLDELDIQGLKKSKKMYLKGLIAADQSLEVYISVDEGAFALVGTISGAGTLCGPGSGCQYWVRDDREKRAWWWFRRRVGL
jgi:hypothetical protein